MSGSLRKPCLKYCFKAKRFDVLEVTRFEYCLRPSMPSSLKQAICSVAQGLGGEVTEGRFGTAILFKKEGSPATNFVSMTEALGARVHTLEEHVEFLSNYMRGLRAEDLLSNAEEVSLSEIPAGREVIEVFDLRARGWRSVGSADLGRLPLGALLRAGKENHFYVVGSRALKIEKDSAYLLASINFSPKDVFYVVDRQKGVAVVSKRDIGLVPTEVFNALVRLQPYPTKGAETLLYRVSDLGLVSRVMELVKARLIRADRVEMVSAGSRNLTVHVVAPRGSLPECEFDLFLRCLERLGLEPLLEGGELVLLSREGMRIRCLFYVDTDQKPLFLRREMIALLPAYYFGSFHGLYEALKVCRNLLRGFADGSGWKEAVKLLLENYNEFGQEDSGALAEIAVTALIHDDVMDALRKNEAASQIVKELASSRFFKETGTALDSIDGQELRRLLRI
jgi:hypothetical protein